MKKKTSKSFNDGIKWGIKEFDNEMYKHVERGYQRIHKKFETCMTYATDYSVKKTKKGTYLNQDKRDFYSGVCVGLSNRFANFDKKFLRGEF